MANISQTVRYGSSGDDVKKLQELLNQNGFKLNVDGQFGPDTQIAVKRYQQQNGLTVDGIVGNNTWGALTGVSSGKTTAGSTNTGSTNTGGTSKPANTGFSYNDFTYDDYKASDTVTQALAALNTQLGAKPGEYQSTWQGQINTIIDQILNREDFSYDLNSDALYQQYKDQYTALGKLAMQDTMGQAAAMTGGYGNSYASTAGNQAYQSYLSQLNEVVPELYGMALDKHNQEGQELYNQYGMLADQENQDYGRYQDEYNQWQNELSFLYDQYNTERNFDYNQYAAERDHEYGVYSDDKSYAYNEYRNAIADEQWQKQFDEQVRQYNEQMAFSKQQYNDSKADSQSGGTAIPITPEQEKAYKKYVGGSTTTGSTGSTAKSNITSTIESKAETFESNDALASWAYGLADAGTITEDEADVLITTYMDQNEKYVDREDGSKTISYSDMVKSTNGWSIVDKGGVNWFWGVDNNAIIKAPNGEQIRLDNLVDYLVDEGMQKSDAKSYVKKLQKNLGI